MSHWDQRVTNQDNSRRFQPLDKEARQNLAQSRQEVERTRDERRKMEFDEARRLTEKPSKEFVPVKVKRPRSPFMAKPVAELGQDDAPPKIYEAPQPDLNVAPKTRVANPGTSLAEKRRATPAAEATKRREPSRRSEREV